MASQGLQGPLALLQQDPYVFQREPGLPLFQTEGVVLNTVIPFPFHPSPFSFVPSSVSFYTQESLPLMECGGFKVERLISNLPPRPL